MQGKAIVMSDGMLDTKGAKTTHGLIRGSLRFDVVGVIDPVFAGQDAGVILDGRHRDLPIYSDVSTFLATSQKVDFCVIGIAPKGGRLPERMKADIITAMNHKMTIVSGLHQFLNDDDELAKVAAENDVQIHDIRKPRPKNELSFWKGEILDITCPKIAVLGTDCGLGKRTTAKMIVEELRENKYVSEMIFTGQTGWMQGWKYGFILDSTYNDFVSGELESMMVNCWRNENPDMIVVEGQAALRNPSGPCGSELLISGKMDAVVLQHAPARVHYDGFGPLDLKIPELKHDVALINAYGIDVIAITLNTKGLTLEEAKSYQEKYEREFNIPVALPVEEGVSKLLPALQKLMKK